MRLLIVALLVSAAALTPLAAATDVPACVGYEDCSERTGDGFAALCVKGPKGFTRWICMECEACGNGPGLRSAGWPTLPWSSCVTPAGKHGIPAPSRRARCPLGRRTVKYQPSDIVER